MAQVIKWELYDEVEDLAVNLKYLHSCIGEKDPATGCQKPIKGGRHNQGYLMLRAYDIDKVGEPHAKGKMVTAHRVLARLKFKTPLDPKDKVYHTCGNMDCLNPDHLAIGDMEDVHGMMARLGLHNNGDNGGPGPSGLAPMAGRRYVYSIEQMLYARYHHNHEIRSKFNMTMAQASRLKSAIKHNVYRWLDAYDPLRTNTPLPIIDITVLR